MDPNHLPVDLNCRMFDQPNDDYNHFGMIIGRPGFSRIDLALTVGRQHNGDWPRSFLTNLLRYALAAAKDLIHFSFSTNVESSDFGVHPESDGSNDLWIPLRMFLPVTEWTNLRHFGLSRFMVTQSDVLAFLRILPPTLQSLELSYLFFKRTEGAFGDLLVDMRDQLGWRERAPVERPRIIVKVDDCDQGYLLGNPVDISGEVEDFVYRDGENPFNLPETYPDGRVRLPPAQLGLASNGTPSSRSIGGLTSTCANLKDWVISRKTMLISEQRSGSKNVVWNGITGRGSRRRCTFLYRYMYLMYCLHERQGRQ